VPKNVKVELPFRACRWISRRGFGSVFGRTLVVAEEGAEVVLVDELASPDFGAQTLSVGGTEIFADEGAKVHYVVLQRWGGGVLHLTTDRLVAGRDARITTLNLALGSDVTRADIQCKLQKPGAHVDMLGLYIAEGTQHIDHQTLQDHIAPHASSNLLFKGALRDQGRSVFRGLIRVHPKAQRTDAYQTNRNLILSQRGARGLAAEPRDRRRRRALLARRHRRPAGRGGDLLPALAAASPSRRRCGWWSSASSARCWTRWSCRRSRRS
jgi:Fe-S cluster assembly protein SufD